MISLIILEYHNLSDIEVFLSSIKGYVMQDDEIIVSSNSLYEKEKHASILRDYSSVKWCFNSQNGGFAYGMNEGLKIANGDILMIMNSDVKVKKSLQPMIDYLLSHPEVGIIAPKIVDEEGVIQDSLRHYITPWGFIMRNLDGILHKRKLNVRDFQEPVSVDWVIGAFMMCRRDFYEKVGGLSDDYFMYCEDMDWCKRAHMAGYDVVYYPKTVIEYKGTRAARRSWKYSKIFLKSLMTYWKKYGIR